MFRRETQRSEAEFFCIGSRIQIAVGKGRDPFRAIGRIAPDGRTLVEERELAHASCRPIRSIRFATFEQL